MKNLTRLRRLRVVLNQRLQRVESAETLSPERRDPPTISIVSRFKHRHQQLLLGSKVMQEALLCQVRSRRDRGQRRPPIALLGKQRDRAPP